MALNKNALITFELDRMILGLLGHEAKPLLHFTAHRDCRANIRSILVAIMKSFSCNPLIFLVWRDTVALPQPKLILG